MIDTVTGATVDMVAKIASPDETDPSGGVLLGSNDTVNLGDIDRTDFAGPG